MRTVLVIAAAAAVFLIAGIGFSQHTASREERPASSWAYHQSPFFDLASFIDDSVAKAAGAARVDLDAVAGGLVPHHVPTAIPLLAEFYVKLKQTRAVSSFVVIGPDHIDAGRGDISVSKARFVTPFGTLEPDTDLIAELEASGVVVHDEAPFENEHSIDSQMLLISKLFPDARVVPLVVRSSAANETARALGSALAALAHGGVFVVGSVDFSHYLSGVQARPVDRLSADILAAASAGSVPFVDADSKQTLVALFSFFEAMGADRSADVRVFNTADFTPTGDYTTGYVTGFWGTQSAQAR